MPVGNPANFCHSLAGYKASSLGERLKPLVECESDSFEKTTMDYIGKGVTVEYPIQIRRESKIASDLTQASMKHLCTLRSKGREVLGIARVTDYRVRANAIQNERWRREACGTDRYVGLTVELLRARRNFDLASAGS
jgi:hypothetical protein